MGTIVGIREQLAITRCQWQIVTNNAIVGIPYAVRSRSGAGSPPTSNR